MATLSYPPLKRESCNNASMKNPACNHVCSSWHEMEKNDECPECHQEAAKNNECPECHQQAASRYANQSLNEHSNQSSDRVCIEHGLHQEAYCEDCEKPICAACFKKCILKEHMCVPKNEYRDYIRAKRQEMKESLDMLGRLTEDCNRRTQMICSQKESVCEQICHYATRMQEEIAVQRQNMLDAAQAMATQQRTYLQRHEKTAKSLEETLEEAFNHCGEEGNAGVTFYKRLMDDVNKALENAKELCQSLPPQSKMKVAFREAIAEAIIEQVKSQFGQSVCLSMPASPDDIRIEGAGSRRAIVGIQAQFEVTAVHSLSHLPTIITEEVSCVLVPQKTRGQADRIECACETVGEDKFTVSYMAKQPGVYTLDVQVGGEKVFQNSPTVVTVAPCFEEYRYETRERRGVSVEQLHNPNGVAVNKEGLMVIAETSDHRVTMKAFGSPRKHFGRQGSAEGEFMNPSGIAFTRNSTQFLVTDTGNHRIQKMTLQGQVVAVVGCRGQGCLQFDTPTAIAVDYNGRALVVETGNKRIQVLTPDLHFHQFIRCTPSRICNFTCIGVDTQDKIFVGCEEHYIHKFQSDGELLCNFGKGHLTSPSCLCVSNLDLVFVGDEDSVLVFTSDGEFLHKFHSNSIHPAKYGKLGGVAVDKSNNLYISEKDNGRLLVLKQEH